MESEDQVEVRRSKLSKMRANLKVSPLMKKATLPLQTKIQKSKLRKKSACLDTPLLQGQLVNSDTEFQKESVTTDFNQRFVMGAKLGEGAHGVVRKCYRKVNDELLAVKTIQLDQEHLLYLKENFIDIKELKHEHIVKYRAIFFQIKNERCHLVMDYMPYPDLLHIKIHSQKELKQIVFQITETLAYIHSQKICHRDIKPENILYNEQEKSISIVDFGISKKLLKRGIKRSMLTVTGTPYYRAPEMFEGGGYDQLVDMWALGVTVFKLMSGFTPFESEYHSDTIENIMRAELVFPPHIEARFSKQARLFVARLLKRRNERATARQALKDLWFIDIDRKNDEFIRSMTINDAKNKLAIKDLKPQGSSVLNVPSLVLVRNNTATSPEENKLAGKTKQEVLKSLKSLDNVQEQDSMIYGFGQDVTTPPPPESPFKTFSQAQ